MPAISVVIPTRNRVTAIIPCLNALFEQKLSPEAYEVIVVADGCTDGTIATLRRFSTPFRFTLLEQPQAHGAAAARNLGASKATGEILVFLNDDVEASSSLLSAHLGAHRRRPGGVVLGYSPMSTWEAGEDRLAPFTRRRSAERFSALECPGYRFSFWDFVLVNLSIPREVFQRAGGFWEAIDCDTAGEGCELGYRLLRAGVSFQFVRGAEALHRCTYNKRTLLTRAQQEGRGHALIARRHPELLREFQLAYLSRLADRTVLRPIWKSFWRWPAIAFSAGALLDAGYYLGQRFRLNRLLGLYDQRRNLAYWHGVRSVLRSAQVWDTMVRQRLRTPADMRKLKLDLATDLPRLSEILRNMRPDTITLFYQDVYLGRIAPRPGFESLTLEHVRQALVQQCEGIMLGMLVEQSLGHGMASDGSIRRHRQANKQAVE